MRQRFPMPLTPPAATARLLPERTDPAAAHPNRPAPLAALRRPAPLARQLAVALLALGLGLSAPLLARETLPATPDTPVGATAPAKAPAALPAGIEQRGQAISGVQEYRLNNGLTILLGPDKARPSMTINLVYKVGSRQEGPGEAGMAHLLEHMLFKGTARIPDPKKELTRRGIEWNGTTWYDRTNYFGQFKASDSTRDWMLGWLADTMQNIHITADKLQSERPIVINEMQAGENRPSSVLFQQMMNTAYGFHPYGRSVIGVESDLDNVSPASLQAFYHTYYRPDNAVLILTGQFDPVPTLAAIERAFGAIPRPERPIPTPYTLDPAQQGEREVVLRRAGGVPLLLAGYHVPAAAARDSAALNVLADMLTREPDGLLYQRLVKAGHAIKVGASLTDLHDPGMMVISARLASEDQRQQVWSIMQEVLEQHPALSADSLARTQQEYRNYFQRLLESPDSLAMALTEAVAQGDWRLLFAQFDWADQLTLEDVQAAARRWLVRDNRTLAWYLPTPKPLRAPEPSRPDIASLLADHPWKQAEAFIPDVVLTPESITERTLTGQLPGGLRYALLPRKVKGDRVHLVLNLQWGNLHNLAGRWREADMINAMLQSGTRLLPRQAFDDQLRQLDAQLSISADSTGASLNLSVPAKNLTEALALAVSALREPVFPADLFKERQAQLLNAIEARRQQPEALVAEAIASRLHAYPAEDPRHYRTLDQLVADIKAQTPERLAAFWKAFAGASHGQFSAVGNFAPEALRQQLQQLLDDWRSPQGYEQIIKDFGGLPAEQVFLSVPDKANAVFVQSRNIALSEEDPDYPALAMAIRMLGGSADARLSNRLRERESLSYGAYASLDASRATRNAMISIRAIHAPGNLARLQKALQEELGDIISQGFRQQELDEARHALQELRQQYLSSEANVADLLVSNLFWQTDMRRWTRLNQQIEQLQIGDVNTIFRKWFSAEQALTTGAGSYPASGKP